MSEGHALHSPSGLDASAGCEGKLAMEMGRPDTRNAYSDEGTAAHFLASECLIRGRGPSDYLHDEIFVGQFADWQPPREGECTRWVIDTEMAHQVQKYTNAIHDLLAENPGASAHYEVRVPIGNYTGEEGAHGTADCVIICGNRMWVIDLKYGKGVMVDAAGNRQLKLYALGALDLLDMVGEVGIVHCMIHQPRLDTISEVAYAVSELQDDFAGEVREITTRADHAIAARHAGRDLMGYLTPNEKSCRFCKAKSECPALAGVVEHNVAPITDLTTHDATAQAEIIRDIVQGAPSLGAMLDAVPLIEDWCSAVRAEAERILLGGGAVEGYKLVQGKRGNRAWRDEAEAEALLKGMRLKSALKLDHDPIYTQKLAGPAAIERVLKDASPKRWGKVAALITQSDGKPSVAPITDKRPAISLQPVVTAIEESVEDLI